LKKKHGVEIPKVNCHDLTLTEVFKHDKELFKILKKLRTSRTDADYDVMTMNLIFPNQTQHKHWRVMMQSRTE
jgi:hypothetical protein